jgi:hypothetical protein
MTKKLLLLGVLLSFTACKKAINLQNFDAKAWQADVKGCNNQRLNLLPTFDSLIKPQLKGLSEGRIAEILGKPDRQELFRRNQKFYFYYIEKGKQCTDTLPDNARQLQLRFDGIGNVNEVVIIYTSVK